MSKLKKNAHERVAQEANAIVKAWTERYRIDKGPKPGKTAEEARLQPPAPGAAGTSKAAADDKGKDAPAVPGSLVLFSGPDAHVRNSALSKFHDVLNGVLSGLPPDEVEGVSAVELSQSIEEKLFSFAGPASSAAYKNKLRSILFNLKDTKNRDLLIRVIHGSITPEGLVMMNPKDLASDEMKKWRTNLVESKKQALMDRLSYEAYAHADREKADGIYQCPRCKGMKTEYTEKQTRSADEPTTKFCFCTDCDYRWKFC